MQTEQGGEAADSRKYTMVNMEQDEEQQEFDDNNNSDDDDGEDGDDDDEENLSMHYVRLRRAPWRPEAGFGPRDILIKSTSSQIMLLKRVRSFLDTDPEGRVTLHAISAAITKAIDLSLEAKRIYKGSLIISPFTFTIPLVDDWVPKDPLSSLPPRSVTRLNSAIRLELSFPNHPSSSGSGSGDRGKQPSAKSRGK